MIPVAGPGHWNDPDQVRIRLKGYLLDRENWVRNREKKIGLDPTNFVENSQLYAGPQVLMALC